MPKAAVSNPIVLLLLGLASGTVLGVIITLPITADREPTDSEKSQVHDTANEIARFHTWASADEACRAMRFEQLREWAIREHGVSSYRAILTPFANSRDTAWGSIDFAGKEIAELQMANVGGYWRISSVKVPGLTQTDPPPAP